MVKPSNKGKGKPSHRTTFKTKYKIERKVKQHRKKMQKEAKKLKGNGLKHKRISQSQFLPNLFPFKQQILQQLRSTMPRELQALITKLNPQEFGLVNLENKPLYYPRPRENLIKKYITNFQKIVSSCNVVLEVLEGRNPFLSINQDFRKMCDQKKIRRITIVTKADTVKHARFQSYTNQLRTQQTNPHVVKFTTDSKSKQQLVEEIFRLIKVVSGSQQAVIFVAGKSNTGKHTVLTSLSKHAGKYQDAACELFELTLAPGIKIIDAPYNIEDKSGFPLFHAPNPLNAEESLQAQEEHTLKLLFMGGDSSFKGAILSRNQVLVHYQIQDYNSIDDLVKKVGKASRIFGKGGMIDSGKVRTKMLAEWFTGRLNNIICQRKNI